MPHQVTVEFYGIPRQRAGQAKVALTVDTNTIRLRDVTAALIHRFPRLAHECLVESRAAEGYLFSTGGERFLRDPDDVIVTSKPLYLMSADAGG